MMLEDYLHRNAELHPDKVAVICGDHSCTYRQLADRVNERTTILSVKDKLVPFRSSPSIDFLITYFSIHQAGESACLWRKICPTGSSRNTKNASKEPMPPQAQPTCYSLQAPQASRKE